MNILLVILGSVVLIELAFVYSVSRLLDAITEYCRRKAESLKSGKN
ncbi:hypothetical protein [Candidatus Methanodesulfokora washburnensis]|jgi:hypothetical protein|nr:hypothetical protein [Candidatus Methanodesulfokores washburnensis]